MLRTLSWLCHKWKQLELDSGKHRFQCNRVIMSKCKGGAVQVSTCFLVESQDRAEHVSQILHFTLWELVDPPVYPQWECHWRLACLCAQRVEYVKPFRFTPALTLTHTCGNSQLPWGHVRPGSMSIPTLTSLCRRGGGGEEEGRAASPPQPVLPCFVLAFQGTALSPSPQIKITLSLWGQAQQRPLY